MGDHGVNHGQQTFFYSCDVILDLCGNINNLQLLVAILFRAIRLPLDLHVLEVLVLLLGLRERAFIINLNLTLSFVLLLHLIADFKHLENLAVDVLVVNIKQILQ